MDLPLLDSFLTPRKLGRDNAPVEDLQAGSLPLNLTQVLGVDGHRIVFHLRQESSTTRSPSQHAQTLLAFHLHGLWI